MEAYPAHHQHLVVVVALFLNLSACSKKSLLLTYWQKPIQWSTTERCWTWEGSKCSCITEPGDMKGMNNGSLRKSASRENSCDNYIYCPTAQDVQNGNLDHFQEHWLKGQPVIVRDTLALTSELSWEPMVMWRALREKRDKDKYERLSVMALECLTWCEVCDLIMTI
jgi:lysine-specific demethylase 3